VDRPALRWPNGARVALWVIPNIEHFLFDRSATPIAPDSTKLSPDILNYSWRDYGVRVGIWRLMEVLERHGIRGTVALNSDVCTHYPRIIEAGNALGWEWMGHGATNSVVHNAQNEEEERVLIRGVMDAIAKGTGKRPRGWLSPALSETVRTPDLLAEAGIEYVGNWVNDEQPYPMKVKSGKLYSIPYSAEINDIPAMLGHHRSAEEFAQMICDQFDVLYQDGRSTARVMSICLHPFLVGHPHRSKHLDRALAYVCSHPEVWLATGSEIIDAYKAQEKGA
jgi:peptidoglycan/xylan/chitin deacetylase (PgdA/CDA1 family)